jgi:diacylglycerol kinase (ATP)
MLAAFANAPSYGGGMKIAPQAQLDDGHLDICVVRDMSKLKLAALFPSVYAGKHVGISGVELFRAEKLRVETDPVTDIYADGEYVCRTPAVISVQSRALQVIVGQ